MMLLLHVSTSTGHLQGVYLQRNTIITNSVKQNMDLKYSVLYKIYDKDRYTYPSVLSMQFHHIATTDIFSATRVAENMSVVAVQ
jgi:hypothetical protein